MTLNSLASEIHDDAVDRGLYESGAPSFTLLLSWMHSELSEAFDAWRDTGLSSAFYRQGGKPEGWAVELVDCLIILLDLLFDKGVDIDAVVRAKMDYNRLREPYFSKGAAE